MSISICILNRGILTFPYLILNSFIHDFVEDARSLREHVLMPCGLQMLSAPLVLEPPLLDSLRLELYLHPFRVQLCPLLRLQLER